MRNKTKTLPGGTQKEREAISSILSLKETSVPRLEEIAFVQKFMPIFTKDGNVDISEWLEVCGTPYSPVDIVDENDHVLFRVMPLLNQRPTNTSRRGRDSVYEMMETVNRKNAVNPFLGRNYLNKQLDSRYSSVALDVNQHKAWNEILVKYGYEPIALSEELEEHVGDTKKDVFDGFDDF